MADNVTISAEQYAALQKPAQTFGQGLLGAAGSYLSGQSAQQAYGQQAGQMAGSAAGAQFRPVGITSRFGQSGYNYDANGNLIGAGYQVAPDIAAMREGAIAQAGNYLGAAGQAGFAAAPAQQAAQGMFSLGQQFLPTSTAYSASPESQAYAAQLRGLAGQILPSSYDTTAAAQQYMQQQQALQQPGRERSYAALQQQLQNTGRGGLSIAQGGSLGASNPETQAYYNAIAQSDAALAANAQQQARSNLQGDITFGANLSGNALAAQQQAEAIARQNLLGNVATGQSLAASGLNTLTGAYGAQTAAYNPYTASMGAATGLEGYGAAPMVTSQALGTEAAKAGYASGVLANQGYATQATGNAYSPWGGLLSGAAQNPVAGAAVNKGIDWLGNLVWGS